MHINYNTSYRDPYFINIYILIIHRRLILAKINWTFFFKDDLWEQNMPPLLKSINEDLALEQSPEETVDSESGKKIDLHIYIYSTGNQQSLTMDYTGGDFCKIF